MTSIPPIYDRDSITSQPLDASVLARYRSPSERRSRGMIAVAMQLLVIALHIGLTVWLCVVAIPDVIRAIRETERKTERIKRETAKMRKRGWPS